MTIYTSGRKGHAMLERLAEGPAVRGELLWAAAPGSTQKTRRRVWKALEALVADGFVVRLDQDFTITRTGLDALECLRAGRPAVTQPLERV